MATKKQISKGGVANRSGLETLVTHQSFEGQFIRLFKGAESCTLPDTLIRVQSDLNGLTQCFNQAGNINMSSSSGKYDMYVTQSLVPSPYKNCMPPGPQLLPLYSAFSFFNSSGIFK